VVEIAVIYMPLAKFTIGVLLCALARGKATMVAMYFHAPPIRGAHPSA